MPKEQPEVQFVSAKSRPGFFIIDGQQKIAKTGNHVGDPIFINEALLYPQSQTGPIQIIDVPLSAVILIHELGHHHDVKDDSKLDQIGNRLGNFLYIHSLRAEFWNGNAALITYQYNNVRFDEDKKHLSQYDKLINQSKT